MKLGANMSDFRVFLDRVALVAVAILTAPVVFVILWIDGYYERGEE